MPEQFGFAIEYTDAAGTLRYYEPDFVVLTSDGIHYIVEAKRLEDVTVVNKDRAVAVPERNQVNWQILGISESAADGI